MSELQVLDFDALYAADPDPWGVARSAYEQHKLGVVLASLGSPTYTRAWDLACGTGHLARRLAERCTRVLAADVAAGAVELTRTLCADQDNVDVRHSALPAAPDPAAAPDLIVLSEVFYYLDDHVRRQSLAMVDAAAAVTCELVTVHWNGAPQDACLSGPAAQQEVVVHLGGRGWHHRTHHVERVPEGAPGAPGFTLDVLTRTRS